MIAALYWKKCGSQLSLSGSLDRDSLVPFFKESEILLRKIEILEINELHRIDSAGLAILVYLQCRQEMQGRCLHINGASTSLKMLIKLYNFTNILNLND